MKIVATFKHENSTANTERFNEVPEKGKPKIIGSVYIQKWALGDDVPDEIKVTVEG